jgi:hypothetical protein
MFLRSSAILFMDGQKSSYGLNVRTYVLERGLVVRLIGRRSLLVRERREREIHHHDRDKDIFEFTSHQQPVSETTLSHYPFSLDLTRLGLGLESSLKVRSN